MALFLPAWGAALGLFLGLVEKTILYYSASDVAPEIYTFLFASLAGAGFLAGSFASILALVAMRFSLRPKTTLALAAASLLALAAQTFFNFHPELFAHETFHLIGALVLRRGLVALVVAVFVSAFTAHAARPFYALLLAAVAVLLGLASARFFPRQSPLNVLSLPLIAFCLSSVAATLLKRFERSVSAGLVFFFLLAFLVWSARIGTPPSPPERRPSSPPASNALAGSRPNVIIIVLDTLRPDHLSRFGYDLPTSPNIDSFIETATLYPHAKSVSSWTLAAHGSLFTGLWPRTHGARFAETTFREYSRDDVATIAHPLRPSVPTLAESLSRQGYTTAAIASNYVWLVPYFGLDRGFDYYFCAPRYRQTTVGNLETLPVSSLLDFLMRLRDRLLDANSNELKPYYRAPDITHKALHWMKRHRSQTFLLFLNYLDPHSPYNPPAPFDVIFPGKKKPRGARVDWVGATGVMKGERDIDPAQRRELVSQYDGEIAYMDRYIGRLFDGMKDLGLFDDSLVVLLSDHGESFGEHRFLEHGVSLYEDEGAMLLAVKLPAQTAPQSVDTPVQTLDVMPTLLAYLRITPPAFMEGSPLDHVTHPVVTELFPPLGRVEHYGQRFNRRLTALYQGDLKLIRSTNAPPELYRLSPDPLELDNLADGDAYASPPPTSKRCRSPSTIGESPTPSHPQPPQASPTRPSSKK